jgi:hypothetical protein
MARTAKEAAANKRDNYIRYATGGLAFVLGLAVALGYVPWETAIAVATATGGDLALIEVAVTFGGFLVAAAGALGIALGRNEPEDVEPVAPAERVV